MNDQTLVLLCGIHSFAFGIFHLFFSKLLNWKTELPKINRTNRSVYQMLNNQLILVAFGIGAWCFYFGESLLQNPATRFVLGIMAAFWLARLVQQFIFLKQNHWSMWLLTGLFVVGVLIFGKAAFY